MFYSDGEASAVLTPPNIKRWLTAFSSANCSPTYKDKGDLTFVIWEHFLWSILWCQSCFKFCHFQFSSLKFVLRGFSLSLPLPFPHGREIAFFGPWKQPLIRVNFCVAFHQSSSPSLWVFMFIPICRAASILLHSSFVFMSMNFEKNMLRSSPWWWQQFGFHIFLSSRHYLVPL